MISLDSLVRVMVHYQEALNVIAAASQTPASGTSGIWAGQGAGLPFQPGNLATAPEGLLAEPFRPDASLTLAGLRLPGVTGAGGSPASLALRGVVTDAPDDETAMTAFVGRGPSALGGDGAAVAMAALKATVQAALAGQDMNPPGAHVLSQGKAQAPVPEAEASVGDSQVNADAGDSAGGLSAATGRARMPGELPAPLLGSARPAAPGAPDQRPDADRAGIASHPGAEPTPAGSGLAPAALDGLKAVLTSAIAEMLAPGASHLQAERAGVIASGILNAAMIPGWPQRLLASPVPGGEVAVKPPMSEAEAMAYLAAMGADETLLAKLRGLQAKPIPGKKLLIFLATLMTALSVVIDQIRHEIEELRREHAEADEQLGQPPTGGPRRRRVIIS